MLLDMKFGWSPRGSLEISCEERDYILASLLGVDLDGFSERTAALRDFLVKSRESNEGSREYRTGEGYNLVVDGDRVRVDSILELFPDTFYATRDLIELLDRLLQWLAEHEGERPPWPSHR